MDLTTLSPPTLEQIATRAYAIWEREGKPSGKAVSHWAQAVRELSTNTTERRLPVASLRTAASRARIRPPRSRLAVRPRRDWR